MVDYLTEGLVRIEGYSSCEQLSPSHQFAVGEYIWLAHWQASGGLGALRRLSGLLCSNFLLKCLCCFRKLVSALECCPSLTLGAISNVIVVSEDAGPLQLPDCDCMGSEKQCPVLLHFSIPQHPQYATHLSIPSHFIVCEWQADMRGHRSENPLALQIMQHRIGLLVCHGTTAWRIAFREPWFPVRGCNRQELS